MFHIELYGEFFLGDRLQKSDVTETIFAAFIRRLYHTYDGGTGCLCDVTFAPHSPFSYCQGWSGFKRFCHPKLPTFSVAHSDWC